MRFVEEGASYVETTNIVPGWPDGEFVAEKIYSRKLDCRRLTEVHDPESLDIIFGVAVIEHITGIDKLLEEASKILRPGGILFMHGGPIWTSAKGHHLYHKVDGQLYAFTDENCPIDRWEHLMTNQMSLAQKMRERNVSDRHADILAEWIYNTDENNRLGYKQICEIFESGLYNFLDALIMRLMHQMRIN